MNIANSKQQYPGFLNRLLAYFLDNSIVVFITLPFIYHIGEDKLFERQVFIYLASLYYNVFLIYKYQTTIGKFVLGTKIQPERNLKFTLWQVVLREIIGKFVSSVIFYFGFLIVIFDKNNQALHDKIAKTIVVYNKNSKTSQFQKILISIFLIILLSTISYLVMKEIFNFNLENAKSVF